MRAAAGWRSTGLSLWLSGRDLSQNQLDEAMYMTGAMQHAWDRLQRQLSSSVSRLAWQPPLPPRGTASSGRQSRVIAHTWPSHGPAGNGPSPWRLAALDGRRAEEYLLTRDAALAEALAYGTSVASEAKIRLTIAAASALGLVLLAGGSLVVLLRRLVLPLQRLTGAITGLAGGDITTLVPERGRHDEIGAMAGAVEVFRQNAVALREINMRFDAALSSMSQGLAIYDDEERLVVGNGRLCELSGVATGSLRVGMTYRKVVGVVASAGRCPGRTADEVYAEWQSQGLAAGKEFSFEVILGEKLVAFSSRPVVGGGFLFILEDVAERRRNEARIAHMAHHDALTGIPNRVLFQLRLQEALPVAAAARRSRSFTLTLIGSRSSTTRSAIR